MHLFSRKVGCAMAGAMLCAALAAPVRAAAAAPAATATKQHHFFMVYSNPVPGREKEFIDWYNGQHTHDLLQIEGVVAAQFFKLSEPQYRPGQPHPYQYMVIWEIDSDNVQEVFKRIQDNLANGKTVRSDSFAKVSGNDTFTPISRRLTQQEVAGKSAAQVLQMNAPTDRGAVP